MGLMIVGIMADLITIPIRWVAIRPTATVCTTWQVMFMNGLTTGIPTHIINTAWTTVSSTILRGRILARIAFCAAGPGLPTRPTFGRPLALGTARRICTTPLDSVVRGTDPPPLIELRRTGYTLVLLPFYSLGVWDEAPSKIYDKDPRRSYILYKYLIDMQENLIEVKRVLKPGGKYIIVVGSNRIRGYLVESWKYLMEIAGRIGFKINTYFASEIIKHFIKVPREERINTDWVIILEK